jgi:hypothetical protein
MYYFLLLRGHPVCKGKIAFSEGWPLWRETIK